MDKDDIVGPEPSGGVLVSIALLALALLPWKRKFQVQSAGLAALGLKLRRHAAR